MKTTRKFLTMVLVLTMVLTMATTAFAASGGSITINGADGSTNSYDVYKMFDVEDVGSDSYLYKLAAGWEDFDAPGYLDIREKDGVKYATWDGASTPGTDADAAAIAQLAKQYAQNHSLTAIGTVTVGGTLNVTEDGYYLLLSTTGTSGVVAIEGGETVSVTEKSPSGGGVGGGGDSLPNVAKEVKEDPAGTWGESNDADVGQIIEFRTTIKANTGASNYTLHDTMAAGMSFIEVTGVTAKGTDLAVDTDYSVTTPADGCAFHITFSADVLDGLVDADEIVVSYTAKLTDSVQTATDIVNETWLTHTPTDVPTSHDTTSTKTYKIDVSKVGVASTPLSGAEFVLKKGDLFYKYDAANGVTWVAAQDQATPYTSNASGALTFFGVDADTYTLVETKVPAGYKQPNTNTTVTVSGGNQTPTVTNDIDDPLPETGGMGTTLFYTLGGLMVMAAAVLLVTKKRVSV